MSTVCRSRYHSIFLRQCWSWWLVCFFTFWSDVQTNFYVLAFSFPKFCTWLSAKAFSKNTFKAHALYIWGHREHIKENNGQSKATSQRATRTLTNVTNELRWSRKIGSSEILSCTIHIFCISFVSKQQTAHKKGKLNKIKHFFICNKLVKILTEDIKSNVGVMIVDLFTRLH